MARIETQSGDKTYELTSGEMIIGRDSTADIRLKDDFVSGHHTLIKKTNDGYFIRDLQSANGTSVNGSMIDDDIWLQDGATIEIHGHKLFFKESATETNQSDKTPNKELGDDGTADEDQDYIALRIKVHQLTLDEMNLQRLTADGKSDDEIKEIAHQKLDVVLKKNGSENSF